MRRQNLSIVYERTKRRFVFYEDKKKFAIQRGAEYNTSNVTQFIPSYELRHPQNYHRLHYPKL